MYVEAHACWIAGSVFSAAGVIASANLWVILGQRRLSVFAPSLRVAQFVLILIASVWLQSAFRQGPYPATVPPLAGRVACSIVVSTALGIAIVYLRKRLVAAVRKTTGAASGPTQQFAALIGGGMAAIGDVGLREALERFLERADAGDAGAVIAAYDPGFASTRVADSGGVVRMSYAEMATFWNRPNGHAIASGIMKGTSTTLQTRETVIHAVEVVDGVGYTLLTRVKDLGNGWEPMFYSLVWKRRANGDWALMREFVHQRTTPRWK